MATKIISIEQGKKGSSMVKFETPNGDVYVAGFLSLMPCKLPEYYSKTICAIVDKWATLEDVDLFSFLSQKLIVNGYLMPTYLWPDYDEERCRIGKRIKELREKRCLEAKKLAEITCIDAANLCRIEQGKYSVGLDVLSKIASALGAKVELVEQ